MRVRLCRVPEGQEHWHHPLLSSDRSSSSSSSVIRAKFVVRCGRLRLLAVALCGFRCGFLGGDLGSGFVFRCQFVGGLLPHDLDLDLDIREGDLLLGRTGALEPRLIVLKQPHVRFHVFVLELSTSLDGEAEPYRGHGVAWRLLATGLKVLPGQLLGLLGQVCFGFRFGFRGGFHDLFAAGVFAKLVAIAS